ncbi:MAG TPA: PQQ-binding-like beta-propeller repeat protein [Vicinamibacterales bacterium]|nr:PQQ-binding-like beta-propeller repeat protein [Vicinamibacterales bacterium]
MIRQTTICCSAVALIAALALPVCAQTSTPVSRAVKQTRAVDDKTPLALFPVITTWTLPLNNPLTAPPAFRDALAVFALEGAQLAMYDLAAGSRLWLAPIATTVEPAIGTNVVFVAEEDTISALSISNGEVVWRQPFDAALAVAPTVAGDRLILATADGDIVARRADEGTELWRRHLPRAATSRPAFLAGQLFVATADKQMVALNLETGDVLWTRTMNGLGHDILANGDRIFFGSQDRYFYCLNAKDGTIEWRWATGADAIGLPVADDRTVYFVSLDNIVRGLNRSSGVQRWKTALNFRPNSGPLKWSETLVVAGTSPVVQAFSTREGKSLGSYTVANELSALPYLFVDTARVFPTLVTLSSDILARATVTGATRDIEPTVNPVAPLPDVAVPATVAAPPDDLGAVTPLPTLIPVVPTSEP